MTNKEAIFVLKKEFEYIPSDYDKSALEKALELAIKALKERPQGEWIYDEKMCNWKCSECGETPKTIGYVGNREFMTEHFKFCNHCGAQMKTRTDAD